MENEAGNAMIIFDRNVELTELFLSVANKIDNRNNVSKSNFDQIKAIYYHHLHQRVEEHKHSVIGKHFVEKHNLKLVNL